MVAEASRPPPASESPQQFRGKTPLIQADPAESKNAKRPEILGKGEEGFAIHGNGESNRPLRVERDLEPGGSSLRSMGDEQLSWEHPLQDTIFEDIVVYQCCCGMKAGQNDNEQSNGIVVTAESVIQGAIFGSPKLDGK